MIVINLSVFNCLTNSHVTILSLFPRS